jgi:photosystem II stability/assembly factor-like uncharacterized protein
MVDALLSAASSRGIPEELARDLEFSRGLDPDRLRDLPQDVLQRLLRRMQYTDLASARERFRVRQQRDERGTLRTNGIATAVAQMDSIRARAASIEIAGFPTGGATVQAAMLIAPSAGPAGPPAGWKSLGPGNIGGRTRSIVPHPSNPNVVWAASVGGGIWRTDNAGASWRPLDDMMANLAVTSVALDPTNPNILYAGTGEGFGNGDAIRGAGIFMTTDGLTWRQLAASAFMDHVNRVAISSDGQVVLVATRNGIYRSTDPARAQWPNIFASPTAIVLFHPTDPKLAIAGGFSGDAYVSTDAGQTWTAATIGGGRVELTYARANPSVVYASVDAQGGQIWRSTDGGLTYTQSAATKNGRPVRYLGDQGWYGNAIWAGDANDSDLVIVGGIDLWRSTDAGATLIDISTWYDPNSAHADHHSIVSADASGQRVFFGNDGGIYRADDIRTVGNDPTLPRVHGWVKLVNDYAVTQFYSGAVNNASGIVIGGAQDNGTIRFDPATGPQAWTTMFGGDGGWCAADQKDPTTFYGEYVFLSLHRSTDAGASAEYISGNFFNPATNQWDWKPVPFTIADAQNQQALFIAPFVLDPNDSNVILAGGMSLWRTRDAKTPTTDNSGPSWERIKLSAGSPISALTIASQNSSVVWVGHADGQVYVTKNASAAVPTWTRVGAGGTYPLPSRYCTSITIDQQVIDTVYVTFNGFARDNVWRTTDGGVAWTNIASSLPEAPVRTLAVHPTNAAYLYLGTEVGVFASADGGTTWSPTNQGPTNCSVDSLFWMRTTLVCATHGRGMFSLDLSAVTAQQPRPPRRRAVRP